MAKKQPKRNQQPLRRSAPKHRQCPTCFNGALNGIGQAYSTHGATTYYKCDRCGHTWTVRADHQQTVIRHREVQLDGER